MSVLVIADAWDPHADLVCAALSARGALVGRLNLDVESLRKTHLTVTGAAGAIRTSEQEIQLDTVQVVWARRLNLALSLQEEHEPPSKSFAVWKSEWSRHLYWLYSRIANRAWLNPFVAGSLADNKYTQMGVARGCGFSVPATLASNDKEELLRFASERGAVALKFLSQSVVPDGDGYLGLYVHRLTPSQLNDFQPHGDHPIVLQEYITKSHEVRYTVVGDEHLVCRIDSQSSARASVDWRRYDLPNTPHSQIDPPDTIRSAVQSLMRELRIEYGALDFVVDDSGEWWFLEINSNGQWLWIEELTGLDISGAHVRLLMKKVDNARESIR